MVRVPDTLKLRAQYGHKIKTLEELREAIGPRPRDKSVIMCHGTFDIVHPGHLRHLMYASEKADLLIASVTADAHIMKANHRPYVPQELRAANLAALEMVDFVIVDPNPTPIEHMSVLQPDFFAKGYEYFANGVPPKTQEEMDSGRVRRRDGVHAWRRRLLVVGADRVVAAEPRHREAASVDGLGGDRLRRPARGAP